MISLLLTVFCIEAIFVPNLFCACSSSLQNGRISKKRVIINLLRPDWNACYILSTGINFQAKVSLRETFA